MECSGGPTAGLASSDPRKWLNSGGVAEISQYRTCNFFLAPEFKYIGDSD